MNKKTELQQAFEAAELNPYAYSGRCMFGRCCLGVNIDDVGVLLQVLVEATNDDNRTTLMEQVYNASTDSMGRGIVMYWKQVEFVDEEDESEDGDDEPYLGHLQA